MKLTSYEYIPVRRWCDSVPASALMSGSGNLVYSHDICGDEPALGLPHFNSQVGVQDMFPCDPSFFVGMDQQTRKVVPPSQPFIARLENARIEIPGFGVVLDQHLIMAESYHSAAQSHSSAGWAGSYSIRREARFDVDFLAEQTIIPSFLDAKYYVERPTDQRIKGPALMLSGPCPHNYHHWMLEMLPRLWCLTVVPELKTLPIIMRWPLAQFQVETLMALGIDLARIIPFTGFMLEVETLFFPSYLVPGNYSKHNVDWLRNTLMPAMGAVPSQDPHELIYISRGKAGGRRIVNEDAVMESLGRRGFRIVTLEGLPVREQMELFSSARMVVMPHGAACTNIVFSNPGAKLLEFIASSYRHPAAMVYADLNQCRYGGLVCDDSQSGGLRDMIVNVEHMEMMVDEALG